jgi:hypothetical protein
MKGWFTMRKQRVDLLYQNLALEAAYAREDALKEILALAKHIQAIADGHDAKTKGGKVDPEALRVAVTGIENAVDRAMNS